MRENRDQFELCLLRPHRKDTTYRDGWSCDRASKRVPRESTDEAVRRSELLSARLNERESKSGTHWFCNLSKYFLSSSPSFTLYFLVQRIERTSFTKFHADSDLSVVLRDNGSQGKQLRDLEAIENTHRFEECSIILNDMRICAISHEREFSQVLLVKFRIRWCRDCLRL